MFLKMKELRRFPIRLRRRGISGFASASPPIAPLLAMTVFFEKVVRQDAKPIFGIKLLTILRPNPE